MIKLSRKVPLVSGGRGEDTVRAALRAARNTGSEITIPAAVLAQQCRSPSRSQTLDSFLARDEAEAFTITDTDRSLAKHVGALLAAAERGSEDHVDACAVAACLKYRGGSIVTGDPEDLRTVSKGHTQVTVRAI